MQCGALRFVRAAQEGDRRHVIIW